MGRAKSFFLRLTLTAVLAAAALSLIFSVSGPGNDLKRHLGVDIYDSTVLQNESTHGGFHGDGERFLAVDCSRNRAALLAQIAVWNPLPLTESR